MHRRRARLRAYQPLPGDGVFHFELDDNSSRAAIPPERKRHVAAPSPLNYLVPPKTPQPDYSSSEPDSPGSEESEKDVYGGYFKHFKQDVKYKSAESVRSRSTQRQKSPLTEQSKRYKVPGAYFEEDEVDDSSPAQTNQAERAETVRPRYLQRWESNLEPTEDDESSNSNSEQINSPSPANPTSFKMERNEGFIRWSSNPSRDEFLTINLNFRNIQVYEPTGHARSGKFDYEKISKHNDFPALTAYDWSPRIHQLVAVGTSQGQVHLLRVDDNSNQMLTLPLKLQRSCQAVAFNTEGLLAVGLDRVRNDMCLQIWDINQRLRGWDPSLPGWTNVPNDSTEPMQKLEASLAVSGVRFFEDQPKTLVVGIKNQSVRIHDLRGMLNNSGFHVVLAKRSRSKSCRTHLPDEM